MKSHYVGINLFLGITAILALGAAVPAAAQNINSGWTLLGNGRSAIVDVASTFSSDGILTVWKWDPVNNTWAFFTPSMDSTKLAAYSTSKNYEVLKSILPGEGYWVNASKPLSLPDPAGQPFMLNKWNLTSGWNLVSTGANRTAAQFSSDITPFTATTVWAWEPVSQAWYFHTSGTVLPDLPTYITQKGYKSFTQALVDGVGFWVNRAAITGSPTASLPAIDQAKQMFSELRTTVNSWADNSKSGAMNDQINRMSKDIHANPQAGLDKAAQRASMIGKMIDMYKNARAYTASNTNGLTVGPDAKNTGTYLVSNNGFPNSSVYGASSTSYCWADSALPASVTKITCEGAGQNAFNGSKLKFIEYVLTPTAADSSTYNYTATRYNLPVSFPQGSPVYDMSGLATAKDSHGQLLTVGTGTVSETVSGNKTTAISFDGTFPPSNTVPIGNPPPFAGTYSSGGSSNGYTYTEIITVTDMSVVGKRTFTNNGTSGTYDLTGTITRTSPESKQGNITGNVTITYSGQSRSATLNNTSSIVVNEDGSVNIGWNANDPEHGTITGNAFGNVPSGPDSSYETVSLTATRTALQAANAYRYAISGSVAIFGLVSPADVTVLDPNKVVTFALDQGTYVDVDETNSATTGSLPLGINFLGRAQTLATRFTGSVQANGFSNDADGRSYAPASVTAVGTFSDTSAGGAGNIFNLSLTATTSNYASYHSLQTQTSSNYIHGTLELSKCSLTLPSRPTMGLTLTATTTGPDAGTVSGKYTYDNGLSITLSGKHDGKNPTLNSMTLINQDGVKVVFPNSGDSTISKDSTPLGSIKNGTIYYTDLSVESLN
jgi:hypothetical protein